MIILCLSTLDKILYKDYFWDYRKERNCIDIKHSEVCEQSTGLHIQWAVWRHYKNGVYRSTIMSLTLIVTLCFMAVIASQNGTYGRLDVGNYQAPRKGGGGNLTVAWGSLK